MTKKHLIVVITRLTFYFSADNPLDHKKKLTIIFKSIILYCKKLHHCITPKDNPHQLEQISVDMQQHGKAAPKIGISITFQTNEVLGEYIPSAVACSSSPVQNKIEARVTFWIPHIAIRYTKIKLLIGPHIDLNP